MRVRYSFEYGYELVYFRLWMILVFYAFRFRNTLRGLVSLFGWVYFVMDGDESGWTCVLAGIRTLIKDLLVPPYVYFVTCCPIKK